MGPSLSTKTQHSGRHQSEANDGLRQRTAVGLGVPFGTLEHAPVRYSQGCTEQFVCTKPVFKAFCRGEENL